MDRNEIIEIVEKMFKKLKYDAQPAENQEDELTNLREHDDLQDGETMYRCLPEELNETIQPEVQEKNPTQELAESFQQLSTEIRRATTSKKHFRFEDIERAFKKFHGNYHLSINSWLTHFIEQSEIFHLNEFEKFIYAKRLMKGNAKLFVEYESHATTWSDLARELIDEYGQKTNSALIHQKLQDRKKKKDEIIQDLTNKIDKVVNNTTRQICTFFQA